MFKIIKTKKHEVHIALGFGDKEKPLETKGISLTARNKDYAGNRALLIRVHIWGTYLGLNPYKDPRCDSSGVNLLTIYKQF